MSQLVGEKHQQVFEAVGYSVGILSLSASLIGLSTVYLSRISQPGYILVLAALFGWNFWNLIILHQKSAVLPSNERNLITLPTYVWIVAAGASVALYLLVSLGLEFLLSQI